MNNNDPIYFRLGRRFQRIPADTRGRYLMFMNGELFLISEKPNSPKPIGVVINQIGTMLTVAEYETSGPMNFEEAMKPKEIVFKYIKANCELPSRCELLQMYEQKDKFPKSIHWLLSKEEYYSYYSWGLNWSSGYIRNYWHNDTVYVRRVFRISIKSLFV